MTEKKDRITPLLLDETLTGDELAYWREKEPWNFINIPTNNGSEFDKDAKNNEEEN